MYEKSTLYINMYDDNIYIYYHDNIYIYILCTAEE